MISRLTGWLDARGDLLTAVNVIFLTGPAMMVALVAAATWREASQGLVFWLVVAVGLVFAAGYYAALLRALARQRERRYQQIVRPSLSSEYKNG